jgi:hypothetical protein
MGPGDDPLRELPIGIFLEARGASFLRKRGFLLLLDGGQAVHDVISDICFRGTIISKLRIWGNEPVSGSRALQGKDGGRQ